MFLITRTESARTAAARWKRTYCKGDNDWSRFNTFRDKEPTYNALVALGPTPAPEDVDKVIGNSSWTSVSCDDCGKDYEAVVSCGQEPDYESFTAKMCKGCLKKALKLLT